MSETVIHLDGALPLAVLDERGWVQGAWESAGGVCAHQAIRLCAPVPGDAHLIEWVAKAHGHGPDWNDDDATLEADGMYLGPPWLDVADAVLAVLPAPPIDEGAGPSGPPWYLAQDVWMALSGDSNAFSAWAHCEDDGVHAWFSVSVSKCVTHASPVDGGGVTPCCGVTPFELPKWDRITLDPSLVTCDPSLVTCGPAA